MPLAADIAICAHEPIRIPGAIQPHGYLVALAASDLHLTAWSANWGSRAAADSAVRALTAQDRLQVPDSAAVGAGTCTHGGETLAAWAHRTADTIVVEFEPVGPTDPLEAPIYALARDFLPRLQGAGSVQDLVGVAATELRRLTGFGRCLIYRFDADGHGEVLAEAAEPGYESFAGHHFPAADIPAQARDLYLSNRFRLIPDAGYEPVLLHGTDDSAAQNIDLSLAHLRSVSPVHLEYMQNMGTLASMSVSIVVDGKLWGLASCHNHGPMYLNPDQRAACSHFGQLLSMQLEAKTANALVEARLDLRRFTLEMVSHLSDSDASLRGLVDEPALLLQMARATGAAVVLNENAWTVGDVPDQDGLLAFADWIVTNGQNVFESDALAQQYPPAGAWSDIAAGALGLSISRVHRHVILWFRPEIVKTILWAGDPRKEMHGDETGRVHPRRSFASWAEQIGGRCRPWSSAEVGAAAELRQALIGIVLRRAEEMAAVANELGRVNKELEAFSYTVSHDLRAPMRHIAGYVDLVMESDAAALSPRSQRYLGHVKEAAAFAGQLVDALLDFSRLGRSALKVRETNSNDLVQGLVRELTRLDTKRDIAWIVEDGLPMLAADPVLLQVAVRNLLANAVKYTRPREHAVITVRPVVREDGIGLEVEDNGVGFQMQYVAKLFGVFQRLHKAEEFEGTGIGLANVKRIVERHGGSVWARGEPGVGATFGFVLPPSTESSSAAVAASPT